MVFRETQRFTQWWLLSALFIGSVGVIGTLSYGFIQQIIWDIPWGDNPMSDTSLIVVTLSTISFVIAIVWVFTRSTLETKIKNNAVFYHFKPFVWSWRKIDKSQIHEYNVSTFNAILDYGGYGYRFTLGKGRGLIIKGNHGLKLIYGPKKKKLMIGTQRPQELKQAMDAMMNRKKQVLNG